MQKLKLMTIVGTRPEIIRLSETIKKCDQYFEHILVHTGQNYDYELNEIFFKDLKLRTPDHILKCSGSNVGEVYGKVLKETFKVMNKEKPDAILILGDTNSCLSAINAKRLKIPVFHMEAGNRCFDENVPEETNRRIVDSIADMNIVYSQNARHNLIAEGKKSERIILAGSPIREILENNKSKINNSKILTKLKVKKNNYFVVSIHREENVNDPKVFKEIVNSLNNISKTYKKPLLFSTHPRTLKELEKINMTLHKNIKILKPLGFTEYNALQKNAFCVLSDSGTLAEESNILKFRAVSMRNSTERHEALDSGSLILSGIFEKDILNAIKISEIDKNEESISDYETDKVSNKIVKIIASYTTEIKKQYRN